MHVTYVLVVLLLAVRTGTGTDTGTGPGTGRIDRIFKARRRDNWPRALSRERARPNTLCRYTLNRQAGTGHRRPHRLAALQALRACARRIWRANERLL